MPDRLATPLLFLLVLIFTYQLLTLYKHQQETNRSGVPGPASPLFVYLSFSGLFWYREIQQNAEVLGIFQPDLSLGDS